MYNEFFVTLHAEKKIRMKYRILYILWMVMFVLLIVACASQKHYCNCG